VGPAILKGSGVIDSTIPLLVASTGVEVKLNAPEQIINKLREGEIHINKGIPDLPPELATSRIRVPLTLPPKTVTP